MDYMTFTGKTVSDALTAASVKLGVTSDKISYTVVEKGSAGIFGLGSKNAIIRAKLETSEDQLARDVSEEARAEFSILDKEEAPAPSDLASEPMSPADEAGTSVSSEQKEQEEKKDSENLLSSPKSDSGQSGPNKPRREADPEEAERIVADFLTDLFSVMKMDVKASYDFDREENTLKVDLAGPEMGVIIGKRGQTLDALQYLTNLALNRKSSVYTRVKIDTEDYRARRMATLENLAKNVAVRVKRSGRPEKLESMNPYERRIIHAALQGFEGVDTHSEGEEPYRHVVVTPKD